MPKFDGWMYNFDPVPRMMQEMEMIAKSEADKNLSSYQRSKYKKELLEILWFLEDIIDNCDTYNDEDEWKQERDQQKFVNKMSGKNKYPGGNKNG